MDHFLPSLFVHRAAQGVTLSLAVQHRRNDAGWYCFLIGGGRDEQEPFGHTTWDVTEKTTTKCRTRGRPVGPAPLQTCAKTRSYEIERVGARGSFLIVSLTTRKGVEDIPSGQGQGLLAARLCTSTLGQVCRRFAGLPLLAASRLACTCSRFMCIVNCKCTVAHKRECSSASTSG